MSLFSHQRGRGLQFHDSHENQARQNTATVTRTIQEQEHSRDDAHVMTFDSTEKDRDRLKGRAVNTTSRA